MPKKLSISAPLGYGRRVTATEAYFVTIGCQEGGPEESNIGHLKVPLFHALTRHVRSTHCDAIDEYGLVLRVDGTFQAFGDEGLTRLRFAKIRRYITIDIQIPMVVWKPMSDRQAREYLVRHVRAAIKACVARLKRDRHAVAESRLDAELEAAFAHYLDPDERA